MGVTSEAEAAYLVRSTRIHPPAPHTLVSFGAPVFNPVIQYSLLFSVECFVYHWISSQPFGQYMFCLSINTSDYPFSIFIIVLCNPFLGDSPIIHDVS